MIEAGRSYSRLLSKLDRSAQLTAADRALIAALPLTVVNLEPGQSLVVPDDRCLLVISGFVCGSRRLASNKRQITSILVPGDFAGRAYHPLHEAAGHFSALGAAVIAWTPRASLDDALQRSPRLALAFQMQSLVEVAILREWITSLGRREALARVAHLVCELVLRLQAVGLAGGLDFPMCLTQVDIADACGISAVHANRVVQELRKQAVVEWTSKHLQIRDWNALAAIAEFTGDYLRDGPHAGRQGAAAAVAAGRAW